MKIYIILALTGIALAACKKDYTCRCIVTVNKPGSYVSGTADTTIRVYKNIRKPDVKLLCSNSQFTSTSATTVHIGGSSTSTQSSSETKTCELE